MSYDGFTMCKTCETVLENNEQEYCAECTDAQYRKDEQENTCSVCGINWLSEGGCSHLYDGSSED